MAYQITFPEGTEENTVVGTKYLRINTFDTGSANLRYRLFHSNKLKIIAPEGNLDYDSQTLDNLFGITGGVLEYNIAESTFIGGDSGSILATVVTTPKKSIQSYYPEINTRLKTTSSNTQGYDRPGDYWIPCLINKDLTEAGSGIDIETNRERFNTQFKYWGLRGGFIGVKLEEIHGASNRAVQIPFSSSDSNVGNLTGAWRKAPGETSDSIGSKFEWFSDFVYPSPLKVKFSASIDSFLDGATYDMTSSLYLVAQTAYAGYANKNVLNADTDIGSSTNRPSLSFNISSPILISASLGNPQSIEVELILTQSYSRVLDSIIGIPYSRRDLSSREILPSPAFNYAEYNTPTRGWFLTLYSDTSHSSADNTNHGGGTSPYFISGGNCQADISFLFREKSATYSTGQVDRGDYDISNNPYNAGNYFKSPIGTTVSRPSGSEQTYMVIYPSQSFGTGGGSDSAGDAFNTAMLLTSSMFNTSNNIQFRSANPFGNDWGWTTKIPATTNTRSAVYHQLSNEVASVIIEGGSEVEFINNNFNAVIGNAINQERSFFYNRVEYSNDSITPSNMIAIQNNTAERAEIVDSSYTSNSWIKGRYKGTRVSSNNFNLNN